MESVCRQKDRRRIAAVPGDVKKKVARLPLDGDLEFRDFFPQGVAVHAEQFGGLHLVALGFLEGQRDQRFFELVA